MASLTCSACGRAPRPLQAELGSQVGGLCPLAVAEGLPRFELEKRWSLAKVLLSLSSFMLARGLPAIRRGERRAGGVSGIFAMYRLSPLCGWATYLPMGWPS